MVLLKINPVSLIKEAALSLNLGPVGVAGAAPPQGLETILKRRLEEGRCSPFEEQEILPRLHPELLLEGCRSILVLAMPYPSPSGGQPCFRPSAPGPGGPLCPGTGLSPAPAGAGGAASGTAPPRIPFFKGPDPGRPESPGGAPAGPASRAGLDRQKLQPHRAPVRFFLWPWARSF